MMQDRYPGLTGWVRYAPVLDRSRNTAFVDNLLKEIVNANSIVQ
jgi:hypothetical protein